MENLNVCFGWGQEIFSCLPNPSQSGKIVLVCGNAFQTVVEELLSHKEIVLISLAVVTPSLAKRFGGKTFLDTADSHRPAFFWEWPASDFALEGVNGFVNDHPSGHIKLETLPAQHRAPGFTGSLLVLTKGPVPLSTEDRVFDPSGRVIFGPALPKNAASLLSQITKQPRP